jgi:predicted methyltransferase
VNANSNTKQRAERLEKLGYNPEKYIRGKARCCSMDWQYNNNKNNTKQIGSLNSKTYLSAMFTVYSQIYEGLKPGGIVIIIVKPFIKNRR